jgi:murein L,D-transpeptidase YafK
LNRPFVRALLASAAVTAAITLAGCDPDSITPTGRSQAPISEKTLAEIDAKHMDKDSPILARIFKEEAEMEIWKKNRDGEFALLKTYPICRWSGDLGPKKKQGDRQAPEGFYTITPGQMNPASNYYLAFNTGFPNAYDRAWGYTGSELMVHGDCSSRGCYAMTDEQIQEIYALARESFFGGQKSFQLEAFPFRMTAMNMAKHRDNPNFAFWKMIKEGYDHFEATHQEPKVAVCEKRYVFNAVASENASKPLAFNARGACPVFQLDPTIANAVIDHRRQEQYQMANYIARNVAVVPSRSGIDGGMNPVFEAKLTADNSGQVYLLDGNTMVPGALPRTPNRGLLTIETPRPAQTSQPVVLASVPMPQPAPQPKEGEAPQPQPTSIAGLFGSLFSGSQAQATPSAPATESEPVALRGTNTEMAAKPKRAAPLRTASAPTVLHPKPREAAPPKPEAMANNAPAPPPVQQARDDQKTPAPAPEMRTAYSAPPASNSGLLTGAQPVVPSSSFESRWTALR